MHPTVHGPLKSERRKEMPYVTTEAREEIEAALKPLLTLISKGAPCGWINYAICRMSREYVLRHGPSYDNISAILGVLADAQAEVRRRLLEPYEDQMRKLNGDVF